MGAEAIHPKPYTFVTHVDASLMEEVFDISQRQRKSNIHHDCTLDDLGRCLELAERGSRHFSRLSPGFDLFNPGSADNAARLVIDAGTSRTDDKLIRAVAIAHAWLEEIRSGASMADIGRRQSCTPRYIAQRIQLAFLSPAIT